MEELKNQITEQLFYRLNRFKEVTGSNKILIISKIKDIARSHWIAELLNNKDYDVIYYTVDNNIDTIDKQDLKQFDDNYYKISTLTQNELSIVYLGIIVNYYCFFQLNYEELSNLITEVNYDEDLIINERDNISTETLIAKRKIVREKNCLFNQKFYKPYIKQ